MKRDTKIAQPFKIDLAIADPFRRALFNMIASPLEHTLGLAELNNIYAHLDFHDETRNFLEKSLNALQISFAAAAEDLARVPKTGPVVVVSNHPFGGIDGIVLAALLVRIRPDVRVMANYILSRIPDVHPYMFFVDPFGGKEAARKNIKAIKSSIEWVQNGGLLTIFPAGEVSHIDLQKRAVIDSPWSTTVARIIRKSSAPVLPVFFDGRNSALFNLLGMIHPLLRTAMLPREFLNKKQKTLSVRIGNVIPAKKLAKFTNDDELTAYLRLRTYILQSRETTAAHARRIAAAPKPRIPQKVEPIAPPRPAELLAKEIAALPPECLLLEHNELNVYCARAHEVPHTLHEIGRLREITFRGASEGTGKSLDLDRFDEHYHHMFIWNKDDKEIAGAYRLGLSEEILPRYGAEGFYTSTLFQYQQDLLEQIGPALEMGRSFIRAEYQKSFSPLLLLWKGIGTFIARNPRYQVLFGPVSINNQYQSISRQLIMSFLEVNNSLPNAAQLVKPKNPPLIQPPKTVDLKECSMAVRDIDEVSDLLAEIETEQKDVPILLKQYLKLGAKILGFNIDPDFGDVLDGLILVDLYHTDYRLLERFTGPQGAKTIVAYQQQNPKPNSTPRK